MAQQRSWGTIDFEAPNAVDPEYMFSYGAINEHVPNCNTSQIVTRPLLPASAHHVITKIKLLKFEKKKRGRWGGGGGGGTGCPPPPPRPARSLRGPRSALAPIGCERAHR
jgi:hypothetical protein